MTFVYIACLFLLLLFSAFLSASETALFSLSSLKLKAFQQKGGRFSLISKLMHVSQRTLVTILILNVFSNLLVQNTVSSLFGVSSHWWLNVLVPLFLTLLLGEVLPKTFALPNNEKVAFFTAPFIQRASKLLKPLQVPLTKLTVWVSRLFFFFLKQEKKISSQELRHMVQISQETGVLSQQEGYLIDGMLDLHEASVRSLMSPREEVLFYKMEQPLERLEELFVDLEVSKVPVCEGDLEEVLGILSMERYFFHKQTIQTSSDLIELLKKTKFVPETMGALSLLEMLRKEKEDLSMVVDEYGVISGIISQEDLIESVIGEVSDVRSDQSLYNRANEDVIIASGKLELVEFREIFDIPLISKEHHVTLGGWLIEQLEEIPQAGTKYATDVFLFYVLSSTQTRIKQVYVRRLQKKR